MRRFVQFPWNHSGAEHLFNSIVKSLQFPEFLTAAALRLHHSNSTEREKTPSIRVTVLRFLMEKFTSCHYPSLPHIVSCWWIVYTCSFQMWGSGGWEWQLTLKSCWALEMPVSLGEKKNKVKYFNFFVCLMKNAGKIWTSSYCFQHPKSHEAKVPLTSRYA